MCLAPFISLLFVEETVEVTVYFQCLITVSLCKKAPMKGNLEKTDEKGRESVLHLDWVISFLSFLSIHFSCPTPHFSQVHFGEVKLQVWGTVVSKQRWRDLYLPENLPGDSILWCLRDFKFSKGQENRIWDISYTLTTRKLPSGSCAGILSPRVPGQYSHFTFLLLKYLISTHIGHLGLWWEENNLNDKTSLFFSPLSKAPQSVRALAKHLMNFKEEVPCAAHRRSVVCFKNLLIFWGKVHLTISQGLLSQLLFKWLVLFLLLS